MTGLVSRGWPRVAVAIVAGTVLPAVVAGMLAGCAERQLTVKTPMGEYFISRVEEAASFNGKPVPDGHVFIIVWFGRPPRGALLSEDVEYIMELDDVYLTSAAGARFERPLLGLGDEGGASYAFAVPRGTKGLSLHWPGNAPIELGK